MQSKNRPPPATAPAARRLPAGRPSRPGPAALDWGRLQVFLAVCRQGSISGAAAALGVDHSTVLRRIAALEAAAGTVLFERRAGAYALSEAGEGLRDALAGLQERVEAAQHGSRGIDERIGGLVRVTTTDTLLHGLLVPHLRAFCERHPAVRLQLVVHNQFLSLARREADIAIRGSNRPPQNLVGRRVGDIQTAPYASRDYLAGEGRGRRLEAMDWIAVDDSLSHLAQAAWLHRHVARSRIVLSVDSLVGMVEAAAQGLGAAMLLCPLADARAGLQQLAPPDPRMDTQLWILTHPDLRQVARIRAFGQFMFEALSADPRLVHR